MIKIIEDENGTNGKREPSIFHQGMIHVNLDNNEEKTFDNYPIVIKSKDFESSTFKIQKATKTKLHNEGKEGIVNKVLEKAKDGKDKMIDTTKEITEKNKDMASHQQQEIKSKSEDHNIENQEDIINDGKEKIDDPLINRK